MEVMRLKTTMKMIIDAQQLSLVYHVIYMIKELLWYVSTWVLHRPAELAGRALHNMVYDAGCIFEPAEIFPDGKYFFWIFRVSRYLDTIWGHSWIHTLCRIPKGA